MSSRMRVRLLSIGLCLALALIGVVVLKGVSLIVERIRIQQGFDFDAKASRIAPANGPLRGQVIETGKLIDSSGTPLSLKVRHKLVLLVVADPHCPASLGSRDQIEFVAINLRKEPVDSFIVTFASKTSFGDLHRFATSLDIAIEPLAWNGGPDNILPAVGEMVIPSFILTDGQGAVIKTFAGTDPDPLSRKRMAYQIVREVVEHTRDS